MQVLYRLVSRYLWPMAPLVLVALTCMLLTTLLRMVLPEATRWAVDALDPAVPRAAAHRTLWWAATAIFASTVVRGLFQFGQTSVAGRIGQRSVYRIRQDVYEHLQSLPFSFFDRSQTGELMSRATADIERLRMFLGMGAMNLVANLATFLGVAVILFSMNWRLAAASLVSMPALALAAFRFGRRVRPMYAAVQEQIGALNASLQESLGGVRVVKAFGREPEEIARFATVNRGFLERSVATVRASSFYSPLLDFLGGLGTVSVILYGGWLVATDALSLGSLVAFNAYLLTLVQPVRQLGWLINATQQAIAAGRRIFDLLDTRPDVASRPGAIPLPPVRGRVAFENVHFTYANGQAVLRGIDLEVHPGQAVALLGNTGSGKTTLINLLPRFYDPVQGRITIDGHDLRDTTLESLRRQIGLVSQEAFLFSTTIRENIAFGRSTASEDEVIAAAKAAQIHDFIASLPQRYDTLVGERGIDLSGGQKQRLSIARAILTDPRVLILDDSLSSVDTATEAAIQQAMTAVMKNRTSFIIAQRLSSVKNADLVVVLDAGRIVQQGTHAELLAEGGLYRSIYDAQFRIQEVDDVGHVDGRRRARVSS